MMTICIPNLIKSNLIESNIIQDNITDKQEIKERLTIDKTICNGESENNFVRFLISKGYIQEQDLIDIPEYEMFFEDLFDGYDKAKDRKSWYERYKQVLIATKYFANQAQNYLETIKDKLIYLKTSINNSLEKDYEKIPDSWKEILEQEESEVKI